MFLTTRFRYALLGSIAMLLQLQGQTVPKHIFRSRNNVTATGNATVQTDAASNGITYHGGPLMLGTPNIYYIWYGNWASDPTGVTILQHFIQFEGGSPYYSIATTYYDGTPTYLTNALNYVTSYSDNYSRGKVLADTDILAIVNAAITGGHLPKDSNGVYVVLTYQDVQETSGFISSYCGWHSHGTVGGSDIKYVFVGDPNTQGLGNCAAQTASSPNGDPAADAMASVLAHELEETTDDPTLGAWYDANGDESADKCAWTFGTTYPAINGSLANMNLGGFDYLIQQNWVNASGGYCALSLSNVPALTSLSPGSGGVNTSVPVTITGTNLTGATITISGTGVTASGVVASATQITATFTIAAGAAAGVRNVTVATAGGTSNVEMFTVSTAGVAAPAFSPAGGTYSSAQSVTISSTTTGASIRYTADGSTPSSTVGTVYGGPVAVASSMTLKAIAYETGMTDSAVSSAAYTINTGGSSWTNGYNYRRMITIDHTKVPNTDQLNFPVLVSGSYSYLATTANGGGVTNANGYDIVFTSDAAGSSALAFEQESYAANGTVTYWVKVPTLSHTVDTVIYLFYGNAAVIADPSSKTGVWDGNYKAVWHLKSAAAADSTTSSDSTANGNNSGPWSSARDAAGKFGGAVIPYVNVSSYPVFQNLGDSSRTVSCWFKLNSASAPAGRKGICGFTWSAGEVAFGIVQTTTNQLAITTGSHFRNYAWTPDTNWHYVVASYTAGSGLQNAQLYLDGNPVATTGDSAAALTTNSTIDVGYFDGDGNSAIADTAGEFRWSNAIRTSDWIAAEFANQSAPASFYGMGQQNAGGTVSISVTSAPLGLSLTVDGAACTAPCAVQWAPGSSHTVSVAVSPQSGGAGTQYVYANWSDSGAQSHSITAPASTATYTANFTTQYSLTATAGTGGTINPAGGWYNSGTVVSVSATANSGYTFSGFTGSLSGTGTPQNLTINGVSTVTANFTSNAAWTNGYGFRKVITIDHTKVPNTDQLNFPVAISGSYAYLATTANGGGVTNANGYDVIFTSDAAGLSVLPFERESYAANGAVTYWIKVPTVSHTVDTVIYLFYGNAAVTTDPSNKTGTWDGNYKAVWHLKNAAAADSTTSSDSTSNGNNSGPWSSARDAAGKVGGGVIPSVNVSTYPAFENLGDASRTISCWFKLNSTAAPTTRKGICGFTWLAGEVSFGIVQTTTNQLAISTGSHFRNYAWTADTNWHYVVASYTAGSGLQNAQLYVDGNPVATSGDSAAALTTNATIDIGYFDGDGYSNIADTADEFRWSSAVRTPDWIAAEFANQNAPASFYSIQ